MLSVQAQLVRLLLKASQRQPSFELQLIPRYRAEFERNLRLLFPTLGNRYIERQKIAGVPVEEVSPLSSPRHTVLYVHGGAFALGSSRSYRQHLVRIARICNARVLSIDYGLSPEHPFPYAPNQVYNVWRALSLDDAVEPSRMILMGDSAGANIALSAALRLRDEQLPMPGCLVLQSPGMDATFSGESYVKNRDKDVILTSSAIDFYMRTYVQDKDKGNPLISPVFADLHGMPPMLIHVGSDELLLSSCLKLYMHAQRDGVNAELFVGEGMWHNWHLFAGFVPEAKAAIRGIRNYIDRHIVL